MNFFKSILSDDPDPPPQPDNPQKSEPISPTNPPNTDTNVVDRDQISPSTPDPPNQNPNSGSGAWSFGGIIQTFATRSESVLETYRRDLREFRSGLKKETDLIREVATRAVKDLPAEIDGVIKSTAEIISHGTESLLSPEIESDTTDSNLSFNSKRYSRLDAQLRAIRVDPKTYCEEPEDIGDYEKWKLGFVLGEKSEEIGDLIGENRDLEGIYKRVVPNEVDNDTFWARYFYRVHKVNQQESVRASLVRRAILVDNEEELSWDVDDEDDDNEKSDNAALKSDKLGNKEVGIKDMPQIVKEESNELSKGDNLENNELGSGDLTQIVKEESKGLSKGNKLENKELVIEDLTKIVKQESYNEESQSGTSRVDYGKKEDKYNVADEKEGSDNTSGVKNDGGDMKYDEKVILEGKGDRGESCKDSDISIVSSQPSVLDEEDLEWDEIEDVGSSDERKVTQGGSPSKADVRKRLSAAEEDEDLSWDIEDDD